MSELFRLERCPGRYDLREGVLRMFVGVAREGGQGFDLAGRFEPEPDRGAEASSPLVDPVPM